MRFEIKRKFTFRNETVDLRLTKLFSTRKSQVFVMVVFRFCFVLLCFFLKTVKKHSAFTPLFFESNYRCWGDWYFSESKQNSVDLYFSAKLFLYSIACFEEWCNSGLLTGCISGIMVIHSIFMKLAWQRQICSNNCGTKKAVVLISCDGNVYQKHTIIETRSISP